MSNLIEVEEPKKELAQVSPMSLIQVAIESNADIEKLERLMQLQQQWDSQQGRKHFYEALAAFQRECPDILKTKKAHNSFYAPLGDIMNQIRGLLADCGLSIRFEQDHSNGVTVTCVVTHKDGHAERTTMSAPADSSGSKNEIQAIASAVTYLQRYTLIGALGITTADADMDGRLPQGELISEQDYAWLYSKLCDDTGHYTNFGQRIATLHKIGDLRQVTAKQLQKIKQQVK